MDIRKLQFKSYCFLGQKCYLKVLIEMIILFYAHSNISSEKSTFIFTRFYTKLN